jgi:tRNA threonylcarbamoyladenosine biosynthesis protein TsaB
MLLAVDTSTQRVGIALYDGSQFFCEESWISRQYHTVELAEAVQTIISRAGLSAGDLKVLGVATGPGSFTGLRIGMALVKGIAFSHQLPVIGIPTLDITVRAIPVQEILLAAVLQAGRDRLAVGWYMEKNNSWEAEGQLENLSVKELIDKIDQPCIITGEITEDLLSLIQDKEDVEAAPPTLRMRSPKYLAELAWLKWKAGEVDNVLELCPFYLHKGDPIPG